MTRLRQFAGAATTAVVCALVFVGTRTIATSGEHERTAATVRTARGAEYALVLVVSAECAFSASGETKALYQRIKARVTEQARSEGARIRTIGIAVDEMREVGDASLKKFDSFDETSAGSGWLNTGALHYVVRENAGLLGVPQVIIVERRVISVAPIEVSRDSVTARLTGVAQMENWLKRRTQSRTD